MFDTASLFLYCLLTAMLQLGSYLEYHFVEHIPMPLLAHLWFVFLAVDFITSFYAICKE